MKTLRVLSLTLVIAALTASIAAAGTATPRVNHRQVRQQERIAQGVRSGELTRGETARLEAGQAHVQNVKARAKADGVVTPAERAHMEHAQDRQSRHIYRMKHNAKTR